MYQMPRFQPTHAALVHVAAHGDSESFYQACQEAVIDLMDGKSPEEHIDEDGGPDDPLEIFFHTFSYHGYLNMIMAPGDGVMIVDCVETETQEVKTGPLAGQRIIVPRPFSE